MKERKLNRLLAAVLSLTLMLSVLPVSSLAAGTDDAVVYDAAEISLFKDRTLQDVADRYSAAKYATETYSNGDTSTWYTTPASTKAPYAAGVLTADTHKTMTAMTNFYRWLVGVPELTTVSTHSDSLQAQALDRNFEFDHFIQNSSKPKDMPDELWAAGFECTHNILAMGYTPQGAITGWMNEGYSLSNHKKNTLGHRYALIGADHSNVQFGYSGTVAIGKNVSDQNDFQTPFTAFPAVGYMPTNLVSPSESAWSVELNKAVIRSTNESAVTATVTNLATGDSYQCTQGNDTLFFDSERIGFVQPSTSGHYTGSYSVEITGLTDVATGKDAVIRYTTNFVDINDIADSYITGVTSGISSYVIYQTMADQLDKILPILPQEVTVTAESGKQVTVPVAGRWTIDETNKCFVNSVAESALPSNLTDPNNILDRVTIPYVLSTDRYDSYNSLSISPNTVSPGETVTFQVYRTMTSTDTSQIFKLTQNQDGSYSAVKKLDSATSSEFDADDSKQNYPYHVYHYQATANDSGEYLSVYFNSSWMQNGQTEVYVSTSTPTLTVATCQHQAGEPVKENEVAPTCTEEGSYEEVVYCTLCGEELSRTKVAVDKVDHTPSPAVKENQVDPTCTEEGSYEEVITCTICGEELSRTKVTLDKVDHTPSPAVQEHQVDPTCTEEGSYEEVVTCTICGTEISRQTVSVPALGHDYQKDVKAPTCTEQGYTTYTCSRCGDSYLDDYTDPLGHDYVGEVTKEPTAEEAGEKTYTCSRCGDHYTEEIPALGHHWDEGTVTKEPTCTEPGVMTYTCTDPDCGKTYEEVIPATGHTPGEAVKENEKAATCTEKGSYDSVVYCTTCKEELSRESVTVPATGHTPGEAVKENEVAPTCTNPGSYDSVVYCSTCKEELSRESVTVPATGHTPGEAVKENEVAATCTEDGSYDSVTYCTTCKEELDRTTVIVEATGHTPGEAVKENEVAPTCTQYGSYDLVTYCSTCEKELNRETVSVDKIDHTPGEASKENEVAATCTQPGAYDSVKTCTVCGQELSRERVSVPALGHDYQKDIKKPTCTEQGYTTYTCSRCGDSYLDDYTDPLGHDYVGEVTKEPTAEEPGEKTYTCSRCGDSYKEEIPPTGHHWDEGTVTKKPTCTEPGVMTYTCTDPDCGKTYEEVIPATGHTAGEAVKENEKAATCTESGSYDMVVYCSTCEKELSRKTVTTAATGHTYDEGEVVTEATCTEDGVKRYTCKDCGETKTEPIPATGHTYTYTDNGDGTHTKACTAGDDTAVEEHTYVNGVCSTCGAKEPVAHIHTYGEPTFDWSDDYASATATFTCTDGDDEQCLDCTVTSKTDAKGNTVYTAAVEFQDTTYTDAKTVLASDEPEQPGTEEPDTEDPDDSEKPGTEEPDDSDKPGTEEPDDSDKPTDSETSGGGDISDVPGSPGMPNTPGNFEIPSVPDSATDPDDLPSALEELPDGITPGGDKGTTVTSDKEDGDTSLSQSAKTGDNQTPLLWVVVLVVAIAGLVIAFFKKKK